MAQGKSNATSTEAPQEADHLLMASHNNDNYYYEREKTANESSNLMYNNKNNEADGIDNNIGKNEEQDSSSVSGSNHHEQQHRRRHTRNASIGEALMDAIAEEYEVFAEEVHDVAETFVEELQEKDDGESVFFEMGLTRDLSILPSDMVDLANQQKEATTAAAAADEQERMQQLPLTSMDDDSLKPVKPDASIESQSIPLHAYLTLLSAVIALSSLGPTLGMQGGVEPTMKIYWRMTGTYMALFPFAFRTVLKKGFPKINNSSQLCTFFFAACCYAVMCVAFAIALQYTSVGNAVIFANSQALLLLVGKFFVGNKVSWMEGIGALVAFCGGILCTLDASSESSAVSESNAQGWAGWGDVFALISAIGGVGYLVFAKSVRPQFPDVFTFMFAIMFCASIVTALYMILSGQDVSFSREIHNGLWGFLNVRLDRLPLELVMVFVCNMTGSMVRSLDFHFK